MHDMTNKAPWDSSSSLRGMEPSAGGPTTVSESELYRRVQAFLPKEQECQHHGILRWTLHKKVQSSPTSSLALVRVVIKELEKAERVDCRKNIIPLLHTLMFAVKQTAHIPDDLCKRVYDFCKRLLTFPQPYCSLGLISSRQMKAELCTPGLMYERMVVAEQSLKNEHYPFQERVFVFADPEVFCGSLSDLLQGDIQASGSGLGGFRTPLDHMRSVVQHSIQAVLGGERCHGPSLAQALTDMGEDIGPVFQKVVAALEQSAEEGGKGEQGQLSNRLQQLYREILSTTHLDPLSSGSLCDSPLPNPEMSFHLWKEDEDIWKELARCVRSCSMSEQFSGTQDQEAFELCDLLGDLMPSETLRHSVMSNDSGIERDLPPGADVSLTSSMESCSVAHDTKHTFSVGKVDSATNKGNRLSRRGGIKLRPTVSEGIVLMQETLEEQGHLRAGWEEQGRAKLQRRAGSSMMQLPNCSKRPRHFTARIVTIGDDRVLGRLARTFHSLRKREARRLFLTSKVNLQFYYIPVSDDPSPSSPAKENVPPFAENPCAFGAYLGMVDPWYESNIKSLGFTIPDLAKRTNTRQKEPFLSDVISYYVRMGRQPVYFTIYQVKISFCCLTKEPVEEVFLSHLEMEFPEFKRIAHSLKEKQKKNSGEVCGAVVSVHYKKVTLSGRDIDVGLSVKMSSAQISAISSSETEDLNCLTLTLNESQTKNKSSEEQKIRTCNIKFHSLERRSFTVVLDKDSRRAFKGVQSIEISPCLDPCYSVQKSRKSKFGSRDGGYDGLCKYMNQRLTLPINTFSGIIN